MRVLGEVSANALREGWLRLLLGVLVLLDGPERWTQEVWARDERGEEISPFSVEAAAWCLAAAVCRVEFDRHGTVLALGSGTASAGPVPVSFAAPRRVQAALLVLWLSLVGVSEVLACAEGHDAAPDAQRSGADVAMPAAAAGGLGEPGGGPGPEVEVDEGGPFAPDALQAVVVLQDNNLSEFWQARLAVSVAVTIAKQELSLRRRRGRRSGPAPSLGSSEADWGL